MRPLGKGAAADLEAIGYRLHRLVAALKLRGPSYLPLCRALGRYADEVDNRGRALSARELSGSLIAMLIEHLPGAVPAERAPSDALLEARRLEV